MSLTQRVTFQGCVHMANVTLMEPPKRRTCMIRMLYTSWWRADIERGDLLRKSESAHRQSWSFAVKRNSFAALWLLIQLVMRCRRLAQKRGLMRILLIQHVTFTRIPFVPLSKCFILVSCWTKSNATRVKSYCGCDEDERRFHEGQSDRTEFIVV